jgi:hypothetical protein
MAAQINYGHVFAAGGFSGEVFDVTAGPLPSAPNTGIMDFLLGTNSIAATALVAGTQYVIEFVGTTDFTLIGAASNTVGLLFTATGPDLGAGTGTVQGACAMTEDTPQVLISTGALGSPSLLDLTGAEAEVAGNGGVALKGRVIFLSIRNTDILTNSIQIISSATINGQASFKVATEGDYILIHEQSGAWRINILPRPAENAAVMKRVDFVQADWVSNKITCIQTGVAGAGQIGPHDITVASSYVVQIVNTSLTPDEQVGLQVQFATNGDITIAKAAKAPTFNGTLLVIGTID